MKFMITCEEALKNINKGKMGIFNFGYQVLDVQQIKYAQHLACMRKRKLRSYLSKLLQDKKITIYNSRNWAGEIPAQSLIKHIS